jgi:hypothetical protein
MQDLMGGEREWFMMGCSFDVRKCGEVHEKNLSLSLWLWLLWHFIEAPTVNDTTTSQL